MITPIIPEEGSKFPLRVMGMKPGLTTGGFAVIRFEEDGSRSIEVAREVRVECALSVIWEYVPDVVAISYHTSSKQQFTGVCKKRLMAPEEYQGDYEEFVEEVRRGGDHLLRASESYAVAHRTLMAYEAAQYAGYEGTRCQVIAPAKRALFMPPSWEVVSTYPHSVEQVRELMVRFYSHDKVYKNTLYYMNYGSVDSLAIATYVAMIHFLGSKGGIHKANAFHRDPSHQAIKKANAYVWNSGALPGLEPLADRSSPRVLYAARRRRYFGFR